MQVKRLNLESVRSWEAAKATLLDLLKQPTSRPATLEIDAATKMHVTYSPSLGYLAKGRGLGDCEDYVLIEPALGEEVFIDFEDDVHVYLRHAFVTEERLLKAMETYFLHGVRDSDCEWEPDPNSGGDE